MKKNYFSSLRIALAAIVTIFGMSVAHAGETSNFWYYVKAQAYPTGAGIVYATNGYSIPDSAKFQMESEVYYHETYSPTTFTFQAKPIKDLKFVGWAAIETDDAGNESMSDIVSFENPFQASITAKTDSGDDDGSTGIEPYPLFPDTTFVALFGLVDIKYVAGQDENVGTVKMTNPTATVGEEITLTAVPADSACAFVKWVDENGKEYLDNPLTFNVKAAKTFTVEFSSPSVRELTFPEDGGIMMFTCDQEVYFSTPHELGLASIYDITNLSWEQDTLGNILRTGVITNIPGDDGYQYVRHHDCGSLVWGKGRFFYGTDSWDCLKDTATYILQDSYGFNIEDVAEDSMRYYVLAADHKFHQVLAGPVDASRWVLAVPDSVGETNVVIDFILEAEGETAEKRFPIVNPFDLKDFQLTKEEEEMTAIRAAEATEPKTLSQIFDLGGRIVSKGKKGIVVKDGKKTIIK